MVIKQEAEIRTRFKRLWHSRWYGCFLLRFKHNDISFERPWASWFNWFPHNIAYCFNSKLTVSLYLATLSFKIRPRPHNSSQSKILELHISNSDFLTQPNSLRAPRQTAKFWLQTNPPQNSSSFQRHQDFPTEVKSTLLLQQSWASNVQLYMLLLGQDVLTRDSPGRPTRCPQGTHDGDYLWPLTCKKPQGWRGKHSLWLFPCDLHCWCFPR